MKNTKNTHEKTNTKKVKCGVLTCIHCVMDTCTLDACELQERVFMQEY